MFFFDLLNSFGNELATVRFLMFMKFWWNCHQAGSGFYCGVLDAIEMLHEITQNPLLSLSKKVEALGL